MMQRVLTGKQLGWMALSLAGVPAVLAIGCGAPAAPLPPTLNLPEPVRDLAATRVGNTVHLTFSVPQKTTDKLPVRGEVTAELCRSVEDGPCRVAAIVAIPAQQKSFSIADNLPAELLQEPPRLLSYKVSIQNRIGNAAGSSAPAWSVSGPAPAAISAFGAMPRRNGIVLSWQATDVPTGVTEWIRFDRTRTSAPPEPAQPPPGQRNLLTGHNPPREAAEQTLRISETAEPHPPPAIDSTAHTGSTYRYVGQRVRQVTLHDHTLELASLPSAPVETDYRDVFPPPVPTGLVSASDSGARAIDLDWTPDVDPGLAGYIVYRRSAGSQQAPARISPAGKPVTSSAWNDTTAVPGRRYAYSVSAVDLSGNESQRSMEVEDELTATPSQPNPIPNSQP